MPFSRGSSQPRDQTWVSHIAGRFFTICATREDAHMLYSMGGEGRKEVLTPQSWPESNGSIPPNSSIPAMISVRVGISPLLPSRKLLLDGSSCHVSHQLWFPGSLEGLGQVKFRGETFWRTIPPLITWSRLIRS